MPSVAEPASGVACRAGNLATDVGPVGRFVVPRLRQVRKIVDEAAFFLAW